MDRKTIDDLGIDSSVRYATDQSMLDKDFLKESRLIPIQTQVDVSAPYFKSEYDLMFETTQRNLGWADFTPPPGYGDLKKRLFTFQTLPSLGSEESFQMQLIKIKEKIEKDKEQALSDQEKRKKRGQPFAFEEEAEEKEKEKESNILLALIENILTLDKILIEINSRRNQYQKG